MRTDAIIFVSCTFVFIVIAIFLSRYLTKKGALIIPSLLIGIGFGIVISIMANGTFLDSLVVIGVMILISLGYTLGLARMRRTYQSLRKKDKK
ncbi:hypothetical protein [Virgibacillus sp. DJP39]|uniref:hypothetical protein n=1 Tax=Virgibacillus sp. DJP39 TaxID=3409790 RepID=UPI003BB54623